DHFNLCFCRCRLTADGHRLGSDAPLQTVHAGAVARGDSSGTGRPVKDRDHGKDTIHRNCGSAVTSLNASPRSDNPADCQPFFYSSACLLLMSITEESDYALA